MRTFHITYRVNTEQKTRSIDIDALNRVQAERKFERDHYGAILKVEDVTGPEELKELMRF